MPLLRLAMFFLACLSVASAMAADDSHSGYYYPKPQTREVYVSQLKNLPTAGKRTRIGFTVGLNSQQQRKAYAPGYHIFAKGAEAEKLIIVGVRSGHYNTLFRLRALLASLSADARTSNLFRTLKEPESTNFLDLCKLTGFTQVTLSDGDKIAHRILLP